MIHFLSAIVQQAQAATATYTPMFNYMASIGIVTSLIGSTAAILLNLKKIKKMGTNEFEEKVIKVMQQECPERHGDIRKEVKDGFRDMGDSIDKVRDRVDELYTLMSHKRND